jgi:hypothetical protein
MGFSIFGTEDDRCSFLLTAIAAAASELLGLKNAVIEANDRRFFVIRDVAVSRRRGFPGILALFDSRVVEELPRERELGEVRPKFGDAVGEISGEVEGVNRPRSACPTDIVSPELDEDNEPRCWSRDDSFDFVSLYPCCRGEMSDDSLVELPFIPGLMNTLRILETRSDFLRIPLFVDGIA